MLQSLITVFREVFEISILLSIFLFYTKDLAKRKRYIIAGFSIGLIGSVLIALFAAQITNLLDGSGQEIMNIIILSISILMISWTIIWMGQNSKEIVNKIKHTSIKVTSGEQPKIILASFIAVTILREGAEIIMFISGIYASGTDSFNIILGSLIGLALGSFVGVAVYLGFFKIPTHIVFRVTSFLLILLASGLSAKLATMLSQADLVESFNQQIWDSSWLIDSDSLAGVVIANFFGYYSATPSYLEIIFYLTTLLTLVFFSYKKTLSKIFTSKNNYSC
jgi:high-affinity iron transporter